MSRNRLTQLASAIKDAILDDVFGSMPSRPLGPGEMAHADEKGRAIGRQDFRDKQGKLRRETKRAATRTAKQRRDELAIVGRHLVFQNLSPEEQQRRIRRLPKGSRIAIVKSTGKIVLPRGGTLSPDGGRMPKDEKPKLRDRLKQTFTRRKSGLIVPDRRAS